MTATITVNVRGGAKICVPDAIDLITPYVLLEQEDWFEPEIHFVRRFLRPGMQAVDVGANFGVYSMAMAMAVGTQGRVWAIEPTPATADFLQATIDANHAVQVRLDRVAVSDRAGTVQFRTAQSPELNAIVQSGAPEGDLITVASRTLDQLAAEHDWRDVAMLKLDVEGHELQALVGGSAFFRSASPLVMFEIKVSDRFDLGLLEPFRTMGYLFFRFVPGPAVLVPFQPDEPIDQHQLNLFACKPDRALNLAQSGLLALSTASGAEAHKGAWMEYVEHAPYARSLGRRWLSRAGLFAAPGFKEYLTGLALFAQSRDATFDATSRFAMLRRAAACVSEAAERKDTLSRLLTAARLAWELGQQTAAVELLGRAGGRIAAESAALVHEPFLSPSPRYEHKAMDAPADDWVSCAVAEQFEKLSAYSSRFKGTQSLMMLESIARVPYRSPEMERRRQLIRIRAQMQSGPESNPLLCEASEENLNPQYWCSPRPM
jgi:FkbM family methyltransferase